MAGLISKGISLSYKASGGSTYTELTDLVSIPDIGGDTDSLECTTLSDEAHMFLNRLITYGDSINFVFNHAKAQFDTLAALSGDVDWKVSIPDGASGAVGTTCTFTGEPHIKFNGKTYNEVMQYTLSIKPTSTMTWA